VNQATIDWRRRRGPGERPPVERRDPVAPARRRPFATDDLCTHALPLEERAPGLRALPKEARRRRQGRPQPI